MYVQNSQVGPGPTMPGRGYATDHYSFHKSPEKRPMSDSCMEIIVMKMNTQTPESRQLSLLTPNNTAFPRVASGQTLCLKLQRILA